MDALSSIFHDLVVFGAGAVVGGVVIALVYHHNLIKANALVAKVDAVAAPLVAGAAADISKVAAKV